MTDIVIPYLATESQELRYCLRAIDRNVAHDRVIIVGDRPPQWLSPEAIHVPVKQGPNRYENVRRNYLAVPSWVDVAYLFNDDYFVMNDTPIGTYHTGMLNSGHPMKAALKREGLDWLNYEGHYPLLVGWPPFIASIRDLPSPLLRWTRTWHCNHWPRESTKINDCKVMTNRQTAHLGTRQFISTSDKSWAGHAGKYIRSIFSEPSRYDYPDR